MGTPFPGMDPYLERRGLWEDVHTRYIVAMADELAGPLSPRYRAAVEQRSYLSVSHPDGFAGKPDVMIVGTPSPMAGFGYEALEAWSADQGTLVAELPIPEEITERYLEIREVSTDRVITVIELLSPSNKLSREGRDEYERKRLKVLGSLTHLIEIDLLRAGTPPEFRLRQPAASSDYRITISRSERRPYADLHLFGIREPIPGIRIPLKRGEDEPVLPLNRLLHELYDRARYDLAIHYNRPAEPPLNELDAVWVQSIIKP